MDNYGRGKLATAELFQGMTKEITPEQLIKLDPDYIVVGGLNQATAHKALMADKNLAGLKAIKARHVYRIPRAPSSGIDLALNRLYRWFGWLKLYTLINLLMWT